MKEIIYINPVLKETIWGGDRLQEFGYEIPSEHTGEAWVISAHPNGDGTIAGGTYDGIHLSQLWEQHRELFGDAEGEQFPLLTKIIDAQADLSIQVHPDDAYAKVHEHGSLGKTECWYILDCDADATIVIGHHARNHEEVESMIKGHYWDAFIREIPVQKGDFFQIDPGTVHAIKGGTLILETQQNSDITYRVYDYDRLSGGKLRELHVEQSINVIKAPYVDAEPKKNDAATLNKNMHNLVSCDYYNVWKMDIDGCTSFVQDQQFMLISVIEGEGTIDGQRIQKGQNFILPFGYGEARVEGEMQWILAAIQ